MSEFDLHIAQPDRGVHSTDLFIYDAAEPGTGALVSVVSPPEIDDRPVVFADTPDLQVSFLMDRSSNTAQVAFLHKGENPTTEHKTFRLTLEFQIQDKCSLTVLFSDWKIVALIDGEPLERIV